jgi:hypothetical protein
MKTRAQSASEMNERLSEIGAELAAWGGIPVRNAGELEAERDALRIAYRDQLAREATPPSDETLAAVREQEARAERMKAALAEAAR